MPLVLLKILKKGEDSDGNTEYNPVFQFKTANNEVVIIYDNKWSGNKAWSIGDKVMIAYNPDYPKEAKVMTFYRILERRCFFYAYHCRLQYMVLGIMLWRGFLGSGGLVIIRVFPFCKEYLELLYLLRKYKITGKYQYGMTGQVSNLFIKDLVALQALLSKIVHLLVRTVLFAPIRAWTWLDNVRTYFYFLLTLL